MDNKVNSMVQKKWEDYAAKFNTLSSLMEDANISNKLLRDVIEARVIFEKEVVKSKIIEALK